MQAWLIEHRRGLALVSGVAALVWMAMAWQAPARRVASDPAPLAAPLAAPAAAADVPPPPRASTEVGAAPREAAPPPGVTLAQWQALQDELRGDPNGAAELARIADYLAWSDALRRLRESRGDAVEGRRLARAVDAGLPARLRAGEVSSAEARQIEIAVLEVTLDDPAERAAALKTWTASHTSPAIADPRQAEFDRRQAAIVGAWSAQPARARDPAALERELDALRRSIFSETPAQTTR